MPFDAMSVSRRTSTLSPKLPVQDVTSPLNYTQVRKKNIIHELHMPCRSYTNCNKEVEVKPMLVVVTTTICDTNIT